MATQQQNPVANPFTKGVTDLSRRLRVLEERYTILRRKEQLTGENILAAEKESQEQLDSMESELVELRRMLVELDAKMDRFLEQVKKAAPREDVLVLRKYVELWDPVRYVTREEAIRLIERKD